VLEDRFKLIWSDGKIKKAIAAGAVVFVDLIKAFGQAFVTRLVVEVALVVKNRLSKRLPNLVAHGLARKFACRFFKIAPEFVITFLAPSESDNFYRRRQVTIGCKVVQSGHEFAVGEIARSAEDHNGTRLRHRPSGKPFPERVWFRLLSRSIHIVPQITQISADWIALKVQGRIAQTHWLRNRCCTICRIHFAL
jgi:hypothetical protein